MCNEIKISVPYIQSVSGDQARLVADVDIGGKKTSIWFSVYEKYAKYLCAERGDAFVIGLL